MHKPTRLATLLPSYLPHEDLESPLRILASHKIETDIDLIFAPRSLPPHPDLSPQFYTLLRSFASTHLSAPSTSGVTLLHQSTTRSNPSPCPRISTTLPTLDMFLQGGFPPLGCGDLIEFVGPPSSGRTISCLYPSLLHLLENPTARLAYLDSRGSFDPFRCLEILTKVLIPTYHRTKGKEKSEDDQGEGGEIRKIAMDVLDRVSVSRVSKSGEALDKIVEEQGNIGRGEGEGQGGKVTKLEIVVIDQIDDLLGGESLRVKSAQGHANMIAFARRLATLARSPNCPLTVFLINSLIPIPNRPRPSSIPFNPSNPQPPTTTSLPLLSSIAPHGYMNLLNSTNPISTSNSSGGMQGIDLENWTNLVSLSLVYIPASDVFTSRNNGTEGGGGFGRKDEMVGMVEIAKNSRGIGGTGQLVGFRISGNGVRLAELES